MSLKLLTLIEVSNVFFPFFRHRGPPRPNQHWDALEDEVELEDFDLSQPHSQPRRQRPLATLGTEAPREGGSRGSRGSR